MKLTKYDRCCLLDAIDVALDNCLFDDEAPYMIMADKLREGYGLSTAEQAVLKKWLLQEAMGDRFSVADRLRFKHLSGQLESWD